MDLARIRRMNLRRWIDEDPHAEGNIERWCDYYSARLGANEPPFSPGYLRQLAPKSGAAHGNIGEKIARRIERAMGKPEYSLDRPPSEAADTEILDHYRGSSPQARMLIDVLMGVRGYDDISEQAADALRLALKWSAPRDKSEYDEAGAAWPATGVE